MSDNRPLKHIEHAKAHYGKYDFMYPDENVCSHFSKDRDAYLSHTHEFYELIYILSGKGLHFINNQSFVVMAGDVFLLGPDDQHSFVPLDDSHHLTWQTVIWLESFCPISQEYLKVRRFSGFYQNDMYNIFTNINTEFHEKPEDYLKVIRHYLDIIFIKLKRIIAKSELKNYADIRKETLVNATVQFMSERYKEDITLQMISSELKISTVYLCKLFKEYMDQGVIQYLNSIRLEKSYDLLMFSDKTIQQIASDVGFSDVKCYYSLFKKRMGVTPGDFRQKNRQIKRK